MTSVANRFSKPIHKLPEPDKALPLPWAKVGVEIEVEECRLNQAVLRREFPDWQLHTEEQSLRNNGMEFVTPGGMVGEQINQAVENFCKKAKELKFSEGYPRAGIHLHIDVTDMNEKSDTELLNMVLAYMLYEHAFFAYAGEWRRACGFCDSLLASQHDFPQISSLLYGWNKFNNSHLDEGYFSKYAALNFLPLNRFGTVEIRHLPTTFDVERIMDWVKMSLCLKRYGKNVDEDPIDTLYKYGPDVLTKIVFKGHERLIRKYVDVGKLWEAVPDIRSLRIMRKTGKFDPWTDPDNPLLEKKRIPKPKQPKPAPPPERLTMDWVMAAIEPTERMRRVRAFTDQNVREGLNAPLIRTNRNNRRAWPVPAPAATSQQAGTDFGRGLPSFLAEETSIDGGPGRITTHPAPSTEPYFSEEDDD